jgi:hypothetical protein
VALTLTVTTAACGGGSSRRLRTDDVADKIASTIEQDGVIRVNRVDCPEDRPAKKGDEFTCTAVIGGVKVPFRVTQQDAGGNFRARSTRAILDMERAQSEMARSLSRQLEATIRVECGEEKVRVERPGGTFLCIARDDSGQPVAVRVTVKDVDGNISFRVVN